jgi:hypothetical protein
MIDTHIDTADFDKAIARMSELAKRDPAIVVRNLARDYARTVLKVTPIAKKTWWKKVKLPSGRIIWKRKDKQTRPPGAGFAKAGWVKSRIWAQVSKNDRNTERQESWAAKYSELRDNLSDWYATVTLVNKVPYIEQLDDRANIEQQGLQKAKATLDKAIAKFEQKLQEANR